MTRQPIEMHRRKVHTHEQLNALRLPGRQEIIVQGRRSHKTTSPQIEDIARSIVVQVRVETQEPGESHQEHQVEIGIPL